MTLLAMESVIASILTYKYAILFPLAVIEGPILTVIAGFLVSLGLLDAVFVYPIFIIGDTIGDSLNYAIGRFGASTFSKLFGKSKDVTQERMIILKEYFENNYKKTIFLSKLIHGIGIAGLITAGSLKLPYWRFVRTCLVVSIFQSTALILIGIFFGGAYLQIEKYFNNFAAIGSITVLVLGFIFILYKFKFKIGREKN